MMQKIDIFKKMKINKYALGLLFITLMFSFSQKALAADETTVSPADNAFSVELDSNPSITFDKNVYKGTGNIEIKKPVMILLQKQ